MLIFLCLVYVFNISNIFVFSLKKKKRFNIGHLLSKNNNNIGHLSIEFNMSILFLKKNMSIL